MKAMVLHGVGEHLTLTDMPLPVPRSDEVLIKVLACGACRTDVHILDDELTPPTFPVIPGHQIVGKVEAIGNAVTQLEPGDRVGVPWLGETCNHCSYCKNDRENLCDHPSFTGFDKNGGFAEYCTAVEDYALKLPYTCDPVATAPLLCAGLIGYRCLVKAGQPQTLGIYGFGSAASILLQVARYKGINVFVFTSPGDHKKQQAAISAGADWAGDSDRLPPELLDAAILFAPIGSLVPLALQAIRKGGTVCLWGDSYV